MKQSLLILLIAGCFPLFAQYQESVWVETGLLSNFRSNGFPLTVNYGLDDKYFSLEYYNIIYPTIDSKWEANHISLRVHRQFPLIGQLQLIIGGGFGLEFYQLRDYEGGPGTSIQDKYVEPRMPLSLGFAYQFNRTLGIYTRSRYTGDRFKRFQLNCGLRIGILPPISARSTKK